MKKITKKRSYQGLRRGWTTEKLLRGKGIDYWLALSTLLIGQIVQVIKEEEEESPTYPLTVGIKLTISFTIMTLSRGNILYYSYNKELPGNRPWWAGQIPQAHHMRLQAPAPRVTPVPLAAAPPAPLTHLGEVCSWSCVQCQSRGGLLDWGPFQVNLLWMELELVCFWFDQELIVSGKKRYLYIELRIE